MRNKKSSLNLSINAIVILILAITMLGLGLTFMRGLFKQATEKVEAAVSASELVNPPTVDNPLTIAPSEVTIRNGKQDKLLVAFLNIKGTVLCRLGAGSSIGGGATDTPIFSENAAEMTTDQINTWAISVKASGVGTVMYTMTMYCGLDNGDGGGTLNDGTLHDDEVDDTYTKDIVITITS